MKQRYKTISALFMASTILVCAFSSVCASKGSWDFGSTTPGNSSSSETDDETVIAESESSEVSVDASVMKEIQILLNELGYDCGTADGLPGPKTSAAITNCKKDHGMDETDTIDQEFLDYLDRKGTRASNTVLPRVSNLKKALILQKYKGVYEHVTEDGDTDAKFLALTDTELIHYDFVNEGVRNATMYSVYLYYYQKDGAIYMLDSKYITTSGTAVYAYFYSLFETDGEKYLKIPDGVAGGDGGLYIFTDDYTAEELADHYNTSSWSYDAYAARKRSSSKAGSSSSSGTSGSNSGKASGSTDSTSEAREYDVYDVYDYESADEFAEEWAEEFGDGDFEEGYDDACDYWEDNHS